MTHGRIALLRAFLVGWLCFSIAVPVRAATLEQAIVLRGKPLERNVREISRAGFGVEKTFAHVSSSFTTPEDANYFWTLSRRNNKLPPASIRIQGGAVLVESKDAPRTELTDINPYDHSLRINGRWFRRSDVHSLQEAEALVEKLLKETTNKPAAAAVHDFLVPNAEAFLPLLAAFVVFTVLPVALALWADGSLERELKGVKEACERRDERVPYEQSETHRKIETLLNDFGLRIESASGSKDCANWAKASVATVEGVSIDTLLKFCASMADTLGCVDAYRRGVRRGQGASESVPAVGAGGAEDRR